MNLSMEFVMAVLGRYAAIVAALEQDLARAQQRIAELEAQLPGEADKPI